MRLNLGFVVQHARTYKNPEVEASGLGDTRHAQYEDRPGREQMQRDPTKTTKRNLKGKIRTQARTVQQTTRPARGAGLPEPSVPVQFGRGRVPARFRGEGRGFAFGSSRPELLELRAGLGNPVGWRRAAWQTLCFPVPACSSPWACSPLACERVRMDWAGAGLGSQKRKVVKRRGYNFWLLLEPRIIEE